MKNICLTFVLLWACMGLNAKVKPVVHYNFGKSGNVTYAVAPETIKPIKGSDVLEAVGKPVFYADAPGNKKMKGEGGILFNGKNDG